MFLSAANIALATWLSLASQLSLLILFFRSLRSTLLQGLVLQPQGPSAPEVVKAALAQGLLLYSDYEDWRAGELPRLEARLQGSGARCTCPAAVRNTRHAPTSPPTSGSAAARHSPCGNAACYRGSRLPPCLQLRQCVE